MPVAAGAGGAPMPVALPPSNYRERFGDAQYDLLQGQYQGLYTEQSVSPLGGAAQPPNTQTLLSGAIRATDFSASVAYAMLVRETNGNLRVRTFINLARFHTFPGAPASNWDGRLFAQQGDIITGSVVLYNSI